MRWPRGSNQLVFPYPQGESYAYLYEELVPLDDEKRITWALNRQPVARNDCDESLARVVIAVECLSAAHPA